MIDNELIKALECCSGKRKHCDDCPCMQDSSCLELEGKALDLINRQKVEIERLNTELDTFAKEYSDLIVEKDKLFDVAEKSLKGIREAKALYVKDIAKARAEAVKEFAERLKNKSYPFPCAIGVEYAVTIREINDIVKEFEEKNSK